MSEGSDWFLIVWAVVCVVVVLGMSYWVTRYLAGSGLLKGAIRSKGTGQIKIVEQHALGRDQRLVVAQVGETYYLLGVTANNISMLSEIAWDPTKGVGEEAILQDAGEKPAFHEAFFDVLRQKTRR